MKMKSAIYICGRERILNLVNYAFNRENIYLTPTTVLKSSSNDLLMYFWKLNLLPGAK